MLKRVGQTKDLHAAQEAAWTCVLAPKAVADPSLHVSLAEKAVASKASDRVYLQTLGAALYRAGRFDEAVKRLTGLTARWEKLGKWPVRSPAYTWFFLAMAHHRLGHAEKAREYLAKAVKRAADEMRKEPPWNRRLTLKLLRQEAELVIGKPRGSKGGRGEGTGRKSGT